MDDIRPILKKLRKRLAQEEQAKNHAFDRFRAHEERAEKLRTTIETLQALSPSEPSLADPDLSLKDATEIVIRDNEGPMTAPEVAEALMNSEYQYERSRDTLEKSIRGVLSRGARNGDLLKVDRGVYGLPGRDELDDEENLEAEDLFSGEEESPESEQPSQEHSDSGVAGPTPDPGKEEVIPAD